MLSLGYSPCPNDTFMFHDLVFGEGALRFAPTLLDIEELNRRALDPDARLDVTKLSVPALAHCLDDYGVLPAGAALGRRCGPLVVVPANSGITDVRALEGQRVAVPGAHTTALLLLRIFAPTFDGVPMRFDRIMPAVANGEVAAGLIIHESRFTYAAHGLQQVADLGEAWEAETGLPLPLGLIAARRQLGTLLHEELSASLRRSVEVAMADPARSSAYVAEHSQEMDPDVCRQHIALYVNDFSIDLGAEGRLAVEEMLERGRAAGHLPGSRSSPWLGPDRG
jgi:1,4-dihydroxy-6-naphthoate synthase